MIKDPEFKTYDYIIGGRLVVGKAIMDESFLQLMQDGDEEARQNVRRKLIMDMAEYMLDNKLVEFTQQKQFDPLTYQQQTAIMVRAYLAPNDQVKILRLANKVV